MSDKLLPCPCCGSSDVGASMSKTYCYKCGLEVLSCSTYESMIMWNTRTPPKGYALVPVEPTIEMMAALGWDDDVDLAIGHASITESMVDGYKAMLSAAEVKPVKVELPTVLLPKDTDKFESVKSAASIGEAQCRYFKKHNKFPASRDQLDEFIRSEGVE